MERYFPEDLCDYCAIEEDNRSITPFSNGCEGKACGDAYDYWIESVGEVEATRITMEQMGKDSR